MAAKGSAFFPWQPTAAITRAIGNARRLTCSLRMGAPSQLLPDECLELCLGNAIVVPRLDERQARLRELGLGREHIEQNRCTELIALLLHAQILLRRRHRYLLDRDLLLRRAQR